MSHATGQDATTGALGCRVDRYAAEHGLQVATVRKRIQRGQLAGYKGTDHRWYVLDDEPPNATRDRTGQDTRQDATGAVAVNANARAQLEAIRDEWLRPLVETISQQAERIGHLEATGAAKEETLAELRRRAEEAEAERDRLLAAQAASVAPGAPGARTPDNPSGAASAGFWARVRRVFAGGE